MYIVEPVSGVSSDETTKPQGRSNMLEAELAGEREKVRLAVEASIVELHKESASYAKEAKAAGWNDYKNAGNSGISDGLKLAIEIVQRHLHFLEAKEPTNVDPS